MSKFRKIEIIRHNLLGSGNSEEDGTLINEIIYDDNGRETERFNYNSDGEPEEHIIYQITEGNITEEQLVINDELSERTTRTFDEKGRVLTETRHYLEGGTDVTSYEYDGDNLVLKHVIDSDGEEGEKETWEYDNGKIIREAQYSMFGDIERERTYDYDENGLLSAVTETYFREDTPEKTISFYDEQGRMITEKKYDAKGRLVAKTSVTYNETGKPMVFEEENVRGKKVTALEYDDAGNNTIQEETDGNGQRISFVERTFNESGHPLTAEIIMEPTLYNPGQHYRLEYRYS